MRRIKVKGPSPERECLLSASKATFDLTDVIEGIGSVGKIAYQDLFDAVCQVFIILLASIYNLGNEAVDPCSIPLLDLAQQAVILRSHTSKAEILL